MSDVNSTKAEPLKNLYSGPQRKFCACGFLGWKFGLFSPEWYRRHREHHLAIFPDVDQVTRDNLEASIAYAEGRAKP